MRTRVMLNDTQAPHIAPIARIALAVRRLTGNFLGTYGFNKNKRLMTCI